ncbi:MAG: polymer-forming cytoskeletal protein [Treponema sp.]|uniref:bactofilin family protein n=1 Tax=Treponema sp. TaxID=166 RepID=UPI001B619CD9|nr:polymer-forming cytoskeletal protein [Treponema sp.]MBP5401632.1 polymer-forming cytoskeletal protein [Treponema sp.]MBR5932855.1 polymer-forming cytoskeletal protein [Treponema sp.]
MASSDDDFSMKTMISAGSAFSGDFRVAGGMMVDGDIDGNVEISGNIIIGDKARVRGNIAARSATIRGIVIGDVTAPEGIKLMPTSTVIGDVSTHRLQVEDKVVLHGNCISIPDVERYDQETAMQNQSKEIRNKAFAR